MSFHTSLYSYEAAVTAVTFFYKEMYHIGRHYFKFWMKNIPINLC